MRNTVVSNQTHYYHHGTFHVAGGTLTDAVTAYRTYGEPSNPCIIFPTFYGGKLEDQLYLIGEGKVLDPDKYFIVTFALFSNGESSSPSNTPSPRDGPYFPRVTYEDNIRAQHAVLTNKFKVNKIFCVVGTSMGGQQAYYWPVVFPDFVERYVCICGSARTSPHNKCFLEGPKAAMVASKDYEFGYYKSPPQFGIRAFARVFCSWSYSQTWYRNHEYLYGGQYADLESFVKEQWEARFLMSWDANDMITLLDTWSEGDISLVRDGGDYVKALEAIKAKGLIISSKTDLFFPPEDNEIEVSHLKNAKHVVIPTVWGHLAGAGLYEEDTQFIQDQIRHFLN